MSAEQKGRADVRSGSSAAYVLPERTLNALQHEEAWRLVERYCERYPSDWRLVFRRGEQVLEVSVPEEVWRAFDARPASVVDSDNIDGYDEGLPE